MENNCQKKFKVRKGGDGIIIGEFWGRQEEAEARRFVEEITELIKSGEEAKLLIDGSKADKSSGEARKIYVNFAKSVKAKKIAIFGVNPLLKVIATFIAKTGGVKNIKFFADKETALKWLGGNKN